MGGKVFVVASELGKGEFCVCAVVEAATAAMVGVKKVLPFARIWA